LWTEGKDYFISSDVLPLLKQAQNYGIVAWIIESRDSTSAMTHPRMFTYFKTHTSKYYFQHMVGSDHLIIYNTKRIHKEMMLPWVKCALDRECVHPLGAQGVGCDARRKPKYLYMGCHHFEASALNIILGLMFGTEDEVPTYTSQVMIFGKENDQNNTTTKLPTTR